MYGAILGDIIGSPYEFDQGMKTKNFPLFSESSQITDDTIMTLAIADAFMNTTPGSSDVEIQQNLIRSMRRLGKLYPDAGYGNRFSDWLASTDPTPYFSFGNGSAMRVSSTAWLFNSLDNVRKMAQLSASVSHNHSEGIKGAESVASAIFLARTGHDKAEIKAYIEQNFSYNLSRTCDEIRPGYKHVESCQESVPEAITAFLEGNDFEDVIRTAISLGGDCDTLGAIAGSIAEAFYGVPESLIATARRYLPKDLLEILDRFLLSLSSKN